MFTNTVIYLIGYPGVGKYTVAQEIARQTDFFLVDNHLINNPIISLVRKDGGSPFPPGTWDYIGRIRDTVFEAIEKLAPPEQNFILTNVVVDDEEDRDMYSRVIGVFERRNSMIIPVILTCDTREHDNRVAHPDRNVRMKMTSAETLARMRDETQIIALDHQNILHLDTTSLTPVETAAKILTHAASLRPPGLKAAPSAP